MWFLDRLEPGSGAYNIPLALRLRGELDEAALRQSVSEIVRRHEILRTTFTMIDGEPAQVVGAARPLPLPVDDLTAVPDDEREDEAQRRADELAGAAFDLEHGPVLRAHLLRLAPDDHVLTIVVHHIAADGWSIGILLDELAAFYNWFLTGEPADLPDLEVQYADVARWQRGALGGAALDEQRAYWHRQLAGPLPVLELPTDHPRPARQTFAGASVPFTLDAELCRALGELGRAERCTPFMVHLAAFATLLHRYTAQRDVLIGSPIANRQRSETEALIGCFVNTLVLRTDLDGDPTFRDLLARVRRTALDAYANQDMPFEQLVAELQPERDLARSPIFQALFVMQEEGGSGPDLALLDVEPFGTGSDVAKFDLTLAMQPQDGELGGSFEYNTDLFRADTVTRMAAHLEVLLRGIAGDPDRPLSKLPLLTDAERHDLTTGWNATAAPIPYEEEGVAAWFEAQAARDPDAVAVVCGDERVTYRELDRRGNRIAHALYRRDLARGSRIGVCAGAGIDHVAGMLGVLKAGHAYVPLDASHPRDRIAFVIEDAELAVLLVEPDVVAGLIETARPMLDVTAVAATPIAGDDRPPPRALAGGGLAYVIYTSGTTGRPKGVLVPQRALCNLLAALAPFYAMGPSDRVLQQLAIGFDVSIAEILWPLVSGARLILRDRDHRADPGAIERLIAQHGVTVTTFVPSLLAVFLERTGDALPRAGASLRLVISTGEALPRALMERWFRSSPVPLLDLYGPTETCIWSLGWPCRDDGTAVVPIGRPLANTRLYIVDERGGLVPPGVPGELWIGGSGVALGYLARPELTAEKFVDDVFGGGGRLYRTGDRARYRADGIVEYLGRVDHQLKIRGFRIEPGEIEAALRAVPAVKDAVVIGHDDGSGARLVAYVVPAEAPAPPSSELTAALRTRLPDYMIPSTYVTLDVLPLSASGKVDRRRLPAPDLQRRDVETAFVAPRTPVEAQVAEIWTALLGVRDIGVHDDFFALGGHSILATRVMSRVAEQFDVDLAVRALFEAPTVSALALRIAGAPPRTSGELPRVPRDQLHPLSFAQRRLWFLNQWEPDSGFYNIPIAMRMRGDVDAEALAASLSAVVSRHEILRTTITVVDGEPMQQVHPAAPVPLPLIELAAHPAADRPAAALAIAAELGGEPFDLEHGPMLRARLARLDPDDHVLVLVLHHIVADGWSIGLLFDELDALYSAARAGSIADAAVPALPFQYVDYAQWQRRWLEGPVLETQLAYWTEQLRPPLPVLGIPGDRPRPPHQTFNGSVVRFTLPEALSHALIELAQREHCTNFMLLLAAFQVLLHRHSGDADLVVGTPVSNRTRSEVEPLIGFFVNTLVLRADLSADPPFRGFLEQVRETALGAYAHQDVPFERLVEELHPHRDLSRSPLFQAMFNLQNTSSSPLLLGGVDADPLEVDAELIGVTKFDLSLSMEQSENRFSGGLEYNTDLYDAATARRMLDHFLALLAAVVADPGARVSELVLARADEVPGEAAPVDEPEPPRLGHVRDRHGRPAPISIPGELWVAEGGELRATGERARRRADGTIELLDAAGADADDADERPALATELVAPRTPIEERMCRVWSDVLGVERVGVLDNFFDLGGNSLLATRLAWRINAAFGVMVPLRTLFERATVAELTPYIEDPSLRRASAKAALAELLAD